MFAAITITILEVVLGVLIIIALGMFGWLRRR